MEIVTIVGKNSKLYNKLDKEKLNRFFSVIEIGYDEIDNFIYLENPIIFSYSRILEENNVFLNKIINKSKGKIVLISSIASDVFSIIPFYNYPKIKYYSELTVKKTNNFEIIKVGIVKSDKELKTEFYGPVKYTSINKLENTLEGLNFNLNSQNITECWELVNVINNSFFKFIYFFQNNIFKSSLRMFYLFRPLLIICRIIGYKNYGYTFIANKLK